MLELLIPLGLVAALVRVVWLVSNTPEHTDGVRHLLADVAFVRMDMREAGEPMRRLRDALGCKGDVPFELAGHPARLTIESGHTERSRTFEMATRGVVKPASGVLIPDGDVLCLRVEHGGLLPRHTSMWVPVRAGWREHDAHLRFERFVDDAYVRGMRSPIHRRFGPHVLDAIAALSDLRGPASTLEGAALFVDERGYSVEFLLGRDVDPAVAGASLRAKLERLDAALTDRRARQSWLGRLVQTKSIPEEFRVDAASNLWGHEDGRAHVAEIWGDAAREARALLAAMGDRLPDGVPEAQMYRALLDARRSPNAMIRARAETLLTSRFAEHVLADARAPRALASRVRKRGARHDARRAGRLSLVRAGASGGLEQVATRGGVEVLPTE